MARRTTRTAAGGHAAQLYVKMAGGVLATFGLLQLQPSAYAGDHYDKEGTEVVLKRAARQVKDNCGHAKDDTGKAAGPWGKTKVSVKLGHNGHSKGATVGAPFDGKPTGKCAVAAFANLTFPPWSGPDEMVDWDVEIPQPGAAGNNEKTNATDTP